MMSVPLPLQRLLDTSRGAELFLLNHYRIILTCNTTVVAGGTGHAYHSTETDVNPGILYFILQVL